jgi:hypothetical protein
MQSAILGMHSIQKRPVVIGTNIVVRPMMYVALTYDHRLIDGREAVLFLRAVKDKVEDPRRLLLDLWVLAKCIQLATAGRFQAIGRGKRLSLSVAKPYRIGSVMIKQSLGYVMWCIYKAGFKTQGIKGSYTSGCLRFQACNSSFVKHQIHSETRGFFFYFLAYLFKCSHQHKVPGIEKERGLFFLLYMDVVLQFHQLLSSQVKSIGLGYPTLLKSSKYD